ncbi:hypothetical protein E6C50_06930 [Flavobacterium supellecticarium]|uniref:Uncharacterized protein n=1 Tax=Flavobacterium supellecticarium TaxID=2565924 RepID=A0A4S3ZZQ8_9FLAO|nr:hypothetical protein [Flavobacterium supellecticarium]THF51491.1 hypothetical protein E6C50_06930 [Flavobacterium supellecticarium]
MTEIQVKAAAADKQRKLMLSILFDLIGCMTYLLPFFGEFLDIAWAPIAGFILARMYKGTIGTVGGIFAFVEELMPGLDFIPTFTLTWIYTYVIRKQE